MEPKEKRKSSVRYAPEVRERAVRMVREHAGDHASQWEVIGSIAAKIGKAQEVAGVVDALDRALPNLLVVLAPCCGCARALASQAP